MTGAESDARGGPAWTVGHDRPAAGASVCAALLEALARRGVRYAALSSGHDILPTGDVGEVLDCLVDPNDLRAFGRCARAVGLRPGRSPGGGTLTFGDGEGREPTTWVMARSEITYGRGAGWLATGARDDLILARAREVDRVSRLSVPDELVHLVLHCVVEREAFTREQRTRLTELVREVRADPVAAGRAAERVQAELSPALTWDALLADVLHGRWAELLDRGPALRRQMATAAPLGSIGRWLAGRLGQKSPGADRGDSADEDTGDRWDLDTDDGSDPWDDARAAEGDPDRDDDRVVVEVAGTAEAGAPDQMSRRQIRGSGLLLAGRGMSTALKFLAELVIVRYLTTQEYGSWTYALAAVVFLRGFATLGLNRAIVRFLPIHLERGEREDFFGVTAFVLGSLLLGTGAVVAAFYAFPDVVARLAGAGPDQPLDVLFIVILLVPIDTLDDFLTGISAAFTDSRTIFVRRYLLSPGLRMGVALALVAFRADVRMLAYGYLLSGVAGLVYYGWSVARQMQARGLLQMVRLEDVTVPVRRVLSYTLPVMAADWCAILLTTIGPLMLGFFSGMSSVALFRVVIPLVTLIQVVAQSFLVLFEPAASRLYARGDHAGLENLYWRSAVWVAVLTFPAFALSFTVAEPLSVLLFGERYRPAAPILSFLAMGTFVESVVGFNAATLRVVGELRWLISVNVLAAAICVVLHIVMIPRWGAVGAGMATGISWAVYALLKQGALWKATGVRPFAFQYAGPYVTMMACTLLLVGMRVTYPTMTLPLAVTALVCTAVVVRRARVSLSISDTFPELARFRMVRRYLG